MLMTAEVPSAFQYLQDVFSKNESLKQTGHIQETQLSCEPWRWISPSLTSCSSKAPEWVVVKKSHQPTVINSVQETVTHLKTTRHGQFKCKKPYN